MKKILIAVAAVMIAVFAAPAFAAVNPFMDVPAKHWAYDAVAQLASRGVISGYPDGSYKGVQPATRYEMASIVARALAKMDMEKASKQDVEMLKKLIVEFKDELDALGVKVDSLDSRLAVIEEDLGGWSLAGQLRFDAKFSSDNDTNHWYEDDTTITGKNEFDLNRYRMFIRKRIDENTDFTARLGASGGNSGAKGMKWERYYVTTKLPYDITFTVGRQLFDWEGDLGLYHENENDAWFGDLALNMLRFQKTWGVVGFDLVVGRNFDDGFSYDDAAGTTVNTALEQFMVAAKVGFDLNEKLMLGLMGYWFFTDDEVDLPAPAVGKTDTDVSTYGVYAGYRFTPSIQLKGVYYTQKQGDTIATVMTYEDTKYDDSANQWKVMLDINQDLLKFSSLWLEYGQMDNNFAQGIFSDYEGHGMKPYAVGGADMLYNRPYNTSSSTIMGVRAEQQWNDSLRSYARYFTVDFDTAGIDDAVNWGIGIGYRFTPAIEFELAYDNIDYGDKNPSGYRNGDDNIIRFRTFVSF